MDTIKKRIEASIEPYDQFTPEQKKMIWDYYETIGLKTIENEILDWLAQFAREHDVFVMMEYCLDMAVKEKFEHDRQMFRDLFRIMSYLDSLDYRKIANVRALTDEGHIDRNKAFNEYVGRHIAENKV